MSWRFSDTGNIQKLIDKGEPLEIICTRCARIVSMPVEAIARHAVSPLETQQSFTIRLRCSVCGGSGATNEFARQGLWRRSKRDVYRE